MKPYIFYAWQVSYFGGKLRSYLRQKQIAYTEVAPSIWGYYVTLPRHTGVAAIPVVVTPQGVWLQDTSAIIDTLEQRHPQTPMLPATPVLRLLCYLFEMWADELWIPTGLHTRWCHMEDNYAFLEKDVAKNLLPGWPAWAQRKAAAQVAGHMAQYLSATGVNPAQYDVLHRWTVQQLDWLDAHLATRPFLLGSHACLADVAMMGPLYGHLSRDPWPAQHLINPRPHLKAWIARMNQAPAEPVGTAVTDHVPSTLEPLVQQMLRELLAYTQGNLQQVEQARLAEPGLTLLPRFMGQISHPMLDAHYTRRAMPYILWMQQRMQSAFKSMSASEQNSARNWLAQYQATALVDTTLPALKRHGLGLALIP
jgi:glutathione S-transferase